MLEHGVEDRIALELAVHDSAGRAVASGKTDALGSLVFRNLTAGSGYTVRTTTARPAQISRHVTVMSVANSLPDRTFYAKQKLKPGFNYITTRDGTTLSAYVTFPADVSQGPFPTVVDYSGYDPSNWNAAMEKSTVWGEEIPIGRFYERTDVPSLEETEPVLDDGPLINRDLRVDPEAAKQFVEELM